MGSLKNPDALPPPLTHRAELDRRWAAYLTQADLLLERR